MGVSNMVPDRELVVEWAPFQLADGVTEEQLLAASEMLQREFLARQPGFVRRELLRGRGGQWVDLVHWETAEAASAVFAAAGTSAICRAYFELMVAPAGVDPSEAVLHLHGVRDYVARLHKCKRPGRIARPVPSC
jgi:hypothetical protein